MSDGKQIVIDELSGCLDIPDSAYDKAESRYKDLGDWFSRPDAFCADFDPHIYPQGSFRLGTVVSAEEYDLDFGCRLRTGISKATHTQEQLKQLVGQDIEAYRKARQIEKALEEKTRCWRLHYKDGIAFHMDGVPSIPEVQQQRQLLAEGMVKYGSTDKFLAERVAEHAGSITDNTDAHYRAIHPGWRISNSEGFALWFESRVKLARRLLEERALAAKAASVDDLPTRKLKLPLQRCVQILKCHRDRMFADNADSKPISVIITTLAGQAYDGEANVTEALDAILSKMGTLVKPNGIRIPNPVNPAEDFADKWYHPKHRQFNLEKNFWDWLQQAQTDFNVIGESRDVNFITEQAMLKFGAALNANELRGKFGARASIVVTEPKRHVITSTPAKPWNRR